MKQFVEQHGSYSIFKVDSQYLHKIAELVVKANYNHHCGNICPDDIEKEIQEVYMEELEYASSSQLYIAEDNSEQIIGCIRVMKWDLQHKLPIQKIFDINPLDYISNTPKNPTFWHIGRFAIDSCANVPNLSLFKQLMMYAITPICQQQNSYMIAECDRKLLRVMGLLGISTVRLGNGVHYLGSETIPVYANRNGLLSFYYKYKTPNVTIVNADLTMNVA